MKVFAWKTLSWIERTIGRTPVVTLNKPDSGMVVAKLERTNLTGSVKDRLALEAVKDALDGGYTRLVEATTGNTGISLAAIGSALGLDVTIVMPRTMTLERRKLIQHYGAELVLARDMPHAREIAEELGREGQYFVDQFNNPANLRAGKKLGMELATWLEENEVIPDNLVASVGTGGTLAGISLALKKAFPKTKVYKVSPLGLVDGTDDGVSTPLVKKIKLDGKVKITREKAIEKARELARLGLGVGVSSGANVLAAEKLQGITVTVLPDSVERYFSSEMFVHKNEQMFILKNL